MSDAANRRVSDRYRIWFPVRVRGGAVQDGQAVTYDASDGGLLMLARFSLDAGTPVAITMQVDPDDPTVHRTVSGKILRVGPNDDDPDGLWRFKLAVEFEVAIPGFDAELVKLSERYPIGPPSSRRG